MKIPTKLPEETTPFVWGIVAGAAALAIVGFNWGGWVTGGTSERNAREASRDAVVLAMAPVCADRFRAQGDAATKLADLVKASSWERGTLIERAGHATLHGSTSANSDVARACAELLAAPAAAKS